MGGEDGAEFEVMEVRAGIEARIYLFRVSMECGGEGKGSEEKGGLRGGYS